MKLRLIKSKEYYIYVIISHIKIINYVRLVVLEELNFTLKTWKIYSQKYLQGSPNHEKKVGRTPMILPFFYGPN